MPNKLPQPTFLFYDYETCGTHPALDRPVQFAGIRVNNHFEQLEEPYIFFCQPTDDYLPEPESVLITGITPQQALRDGIKEAEFASRIHQIFTVPNTCIMGYNNVQFDDEVSRNIFYRNFYDPYDWCWQQGNSRWDLLDVMRACYALRPEGIQWPLNNKGLPSFKLEHLSEANGIHHNSAHDAMADVYATLAVARLAQQAQPKLFQYLYKYRNKYQLKTLINLIAMKPLVYVSSIFGAARGNTAWIAPIAWHPNNPNVLIVCDLNVEIKFLEKLINHTINMQRYCAENDEFSDTFKMPLKLVHINKCPVIAPAGTLRPKDAERLGIDIQQCQNNLIWLRKYSCIRKHVVDLFSYNKSSFTSSTNVDSQLYNGFFSKEDRAAMEIILKTAPENISALKIKFLDKRLKELLFRYRARNFPFTLDCKEKKRWMDYRKSILNNERVVGYIQKLYLLHKHYEQNTQKQKLIRALFDYINKINI